LRHLAALSVRGVLDFPSYTLVDPLKNAFIVRTQRPHCTVQPSEA
jgi:hypothetical protein